MECHQSSLKHDIFDTRYAMTECTYPWFNGVGILSWDELIKNLMIKLSHIITYDNMFTQLSKVLNFEDVAKKITM